MGKGAWRWQPGDVSARRSIGMGAWGWEHGDEIMGMRAWDKQSGIREYGWEHD